MKSSKMPQGVCYNCQMLEHLPINKRLVWDYDIPADAQENEEFRRWYVTRVLTHGTSHDLKQTGLQTIHNYFPHIHLPREIREFWQWYFAQPSSRERYGNLDPFPERIA